MRSLVSLRLFSVNILRLHPSRSPWLAFRRSVRYQAFDANLDQDQLAEARKWHQSFQLASIPAGNTTFSRSSGPGGQHVNKFVFLKPSSGAHLLPTPGFADITKDGNKSNNHMAHLAVARHDPQATACRIALVKVLCAAQRCNQHPGPNPPKPGCQYGRQQTEAV